VRRLVFHACERHKRMMDMAQLLKRIPTAMMLTAVVIGVLSPLGAFKFLQTGYWNLVDQSFVVLLLSGILAAGAFLLRGFVDVGWRPQLPLSAIFLAALAALGGLVAITAEWPMVALVGTYQSAYGPIWHLLAAVLVVVVCDLKRHAWALQVLSLAVTVTALIVSAVLAYTLVTGHIVFIPGGDSYALIGFLMLFFPDEKQVQSTRANIQFYLLRASAILLIIISQNLTVVVILGVGVMLVGVIWAMSRRWPKLVKRLQNIPPWGVLALVMVLTAVPLVIIMTGATDGWGDSLRMRTIILGIMSAALEDSGWFEWALGHGWGHTQAAFFQYLHWGEMVLYKKEWDFLWREMFHSHNFAIETVYSVGFGGLACVAAFFASIYLGAPQPKRLAALAFVVGYILYSAVWFEMSFHLPYMALALASFVQPNAKTSTGVVGARVLMGLSVPTMLALGILVMSYALFSAQVYALKPDKGSIEGGRFAVSDFPYDPRQSDFVRATLYSDTVSYIGEKNELHNAKGIALINDMLQDIGQRMGDSRSPKLIFSGLIIFNNLVLLPEWAWAAPVIEGKQALWMKLADRSLELAPYRSDLLIPYLTQLLVAKQHEILNLSVQRIRTKKPDDPVAMYYLGAIKSQSRDANEKQAGLTLIAAALDCGIERFMDVPDDLVNSLQAYRSTPPACSVIEETR